MEIKIFLGYFIFISVISAIVCIFDKSSAINGGRRISERTLLLLCLLGGSAVMYAVMRIIHHKTRHNKFMVGIPLIIALQIAVFTLICLKL